MAQNVSDNTITELRWYPMRH